MHLNENHRTLKTTLKVIALMAAVIMLITSAPSAVALETFRSANRLTEQVMTLHPEKGVTVTLNGKMPAGGYATAEKADVGGKDVLHAYDISIFYANGSEFEPAGDSPISVSFESGDIAKALKDSDTSLKVEHITDSGKSESVDVKSASDNEVVFNAESFSVYLIRTHEQSDENLKPRKTQLCSRPEGRLPLCKHRLRKDKDLHGREPERRVPQGVLYPQNRDRGNLQQKIYRRCKAVLLCRRYVVRSVPSVYRHEHNLQHFGER